MGLEIDREHFEEADYARFSERLERSLLALGELLARRIREALSDDYRAADPPFAMDDLTVTVGVVAISGDEDESPKTLPDLLYRMADRRLYTGKQAGRNRIVGSDLPDEGRGLPTGHA